MNEEDKIESDKKRDDYTDLSLIYMFKIFALAVVIIAGISIPFNDLKSLLITAFTFLIGVIFDFIVILCKNKGPKIRLRIRVTKGAIIIMAIGIIICIVSMMYLLQYGTIEKSISEGIRFYLCFAMICGIISPVLELMINKPNDD